MAEAPVRATFGNESEEDRNGRERWNSRIGFYLAAVGSAVGFGNVWRFPQLARDFGGGAFFIPYVLALFLIGLPVMILEISLGQCYQVSNIGAFGRMHRRFRGVGAASVFCGFVLVTYYSVLLSWVANAFFDSFGDDAPWEDGGDGSEAVSYFFTEIIGLDTAREGSLRPTRLVPANVLYSILVWFTVWTCLAFGTTCTGRIAYITMGLPIIFLLVFLFRSVALEGANDGIEEYIGKWDTAVLSEQPDVWSRAVSQIFFSLSVTFGTMTAYGSHCPKGEPAFWNSVVIGCSNCMFSFLSGFAVFSAIGHLAHLRGVTVDDIPYASFDLVFGTWPVVFGTLSGGIHWVRLLFLNLFLLGIDSAFSILEAPMAVVGDYFIKKDVHIPKWQLTTVFTLVAYAMSLLYATDAGLFFLDAVDFYINFVFLLLGFFECFGAGWVFGIDEQLEELGPGIVYSFMFANFGSVIIACGFWFGFSGEREVLAGFVALIGVYVLSTLVTFYFCSVKVGTQPEKWTWPSILYAVMFKNVMDLRQELESISGFMPWIWAFGMKHFIPQVLLILFINLCRADNGSGEPQFGNYGGYVTYPYQVLGIAFVVVSFVLIIVGFFFPAVYEPFDLVEIEEEPEPVVEKEDPDVKELPEDEPEPEFEPKPIFSIFGLDVYWPPQGPETS